MEFTYLVFTRLPGENYRRQLRSLLLYLCYVFRALINSLVRWTILIGCYLCLFKRYLYGFHFHCTGIYFVYGNYVVLCCSCRIWRRQCEPATRPSHFTRTWRPSSPCCISPMPSLPYPPKERCRRGPSKARTPRSFGQASWHLHIWWNGTRQTTTTTSTVCRWS